MSIGSKPNTSAFNPTLFTLLALVGGDENAGETGGVIALDVVLLRTKLELLLLTLLLDDEDARLRFDSSISSSSTLKLPVV